ncbi:MAG: hypothetical protein EXS36_16800 [Pedosphaera sp.]|nr:hypothetical protein [Pedosphaera sp.]
MGVWAATMILRIQRKPGVEETGIGALTLIELILVMALLVVAFALLAPSLGNYFRGRTLDSEARRFLSLSRYARSRAVSEGVPMVLWLDPAQRAYGLVEEYSYSVRDEKAVSYSLETDIEFQLDVDPRGGQSTQPLPAMPAGVSPGGNAVAIRFQPDGFISEDSPSNFWLRERERPGRAQEEARSTIWITQDRSRVSYEIQTNRLAFVRR